MSPQTEMSATSTVLLFGDGSLDVCSLLEQTINSYREGSLTARFFNDVTAVLRKESSNAGFTDGVTLPQFTTFQDLLTAAQADPLHPALHAAFVVTLQLAASIR